MEKDIYKMSKKELIDYFYSLPVNEGEETVEPFEIDGDIEEWARSHGYIPLEEALKKLSELEKGRDGYETDRRND